MTLAVTRIVLSFEKICYKAPVCEEVTATVFSNTTAMKAPASLIVHNALIQSHALSSYARTLPEIGRVERPEFSAHSVESGGILFVTKLLIRNEQCC